MREVSKDRDNVIIRIESLVKNLPTSSTESKPIIFKVDDHLHQVDERDYEPEIVSIGPIHHGKDHVKDMEQQKVRYLKQLLQRRSDKLSIGKCIKELRNLEEMARRCYAKTIHLNQDEFLEMLLLDGCFVIELIRKYWFNHLRDKDDLIFQFDQTLSKLRHDLMLFENQLPFFVLNQLFNMTKMEDPDDNILYLVLFFVDDTFPWLDVSRVDSKLDILNHEPHHLLGLVYQSCFPFLNKGFTENEGHKENNLILTINSASELKEAGIWLKGFKGTTLMDVTFENGFIKLPHLSVSDKTESLLKNIIAYEQCLQNSHPKYVTDYAYLMHCLVHSSKDIEILRRYGIISNLLGGNEIVMFNRLGKNVLRSSNFCYSDVFQAVDRHVCLRHKKWMAKLRRNYFNSPWALVSFLAAAMLLLLTSTQTVFSVLSYRK